MSMTLRAVPRARGVPAQRPRVRRGRDRAARRAVGPRPPLPGRRRAEDGQARAVRAHRARGVRRRGRGRRLHQPLRRDRGDRPGRPVDGHHPRGRGRARHQPDPDLRHRRAEADLAARPGRRRSARRLRPHRARRRLRRRGHEDQGRAASTGEWVVNGAKQFITNSGSEITSVVTVTARTGDAARTARPRSQHDHGPGRHARVHRRAGLRQARLARLRHPPADLRRTAGCPRPTCSASGAAATRSSSPPSTTAGSRSPRSRSAASRPASTCASQYAGERQTFGVPIGRKQGVAFQIADLEVMLHASRLLTYQAAAMKDARDGHGAP